MSATVPASDREKRGRGEIVRIKGRCWLRGEIQSGVRSPVSPLYETFKVVAAGEVTQVTTLC